MDHDFANAGVLVKRAALMVAVLLGGSASGAFAADWSIMSRLSQSVEVNDNLYLRNDSNGEAYRFISTLMFDAVGRTPTMRFDISTDFSFLTHAGPGAEFASDQLGGGARIRIEKQEKLTTYHTLAVWRRQDAAATQLTETGIATVNGVVNTYLVGGGLDHRLGPADSIAWSVTGKWVDFTSAGATPFNDLTTTGSWIHRLNPTTDLITSLQYELVSLENAVNTQTNFWRATSGLRSQLTKRLIFKGAVGVGFVQTTPSVVAGSGTSTSWLADAELTYLLKSGQFSLFASQSLAPGTLGDVLKTTAVGLSLRQEINPWSSLSLLGSFSQFVVISGLTVPTSTARDLLVASVIYSYRLTREWQMQVAYKFLHRIDDTGSANSNGILFRVAHEYPILPANVQR